MSRMMAYEHLLSRILPQTLPCPRSMALDAVQMVAMDFCRETGVWTENIEEMAGTGDGWITINAPANAVITGVSNLSLDGQKLGKEDYRLEGDAIELTNSPACVCCLYGQMRLRPKRLATEMPEDILEEYGDYLIFGALAKLKAMSGNKIEWHDPKGAQLNFELYQEGLNRAKNRKFRKRFGSQILYVQNSDME